jgi:glycosyltransferase involved in cell wall biosynthesis
VSFTFINYPLETFTPTQSGALATIIWECCRAASAHGCEPYVITRDCSTPAFEWRNLIRIPYPEAGGGRAGAMLWRAERKLTGWRHLRHRTYANRVARAIRAANLEGGPFVLLNDPEMTVFLRRRFPGATIAHWFENQLECREPFRSSYRDCADITFGVSDFTSRWIESYYGLKQVETLYNGVDGEHFTPAEEPLHTDAPPTINFVGRTGREKGPDLFLKAALQLAEQKRHFSLQIVGSNHWDKLVVDEYQQELNGYVQQLERNGIRVCRTGHVGRAELPSVLRKAIINVVPARWEEPFGMTTIEGMACGLATIASRTGGTPEVVGDAGILFERENVAELAESLRLLIDSPAERAVLRLRGRERALGFSWERTWSELAARVH